MGLMRLMGLMGPIDPIRPIGPQSGIPSFGFGSADAEP